MIELRQVSVTFKQDKKTIDAVKNVSLTINRGDIFGVIGYSGAGKSTLVRTINVLQPPTAGEVVVNGQSMAHLTGKALRQARKKIGMIFQHFNLMNALNVYDNVAFPLRYAGHSKTYIHEKVMSLLELVGISDKAKAYPGQLSGGQKQRVAIARALANDPEVLLCDEATSALDPKTTYAILELLKKVNQELGITIVIITHEMQVVKEICNRVAIMENGEVIEEGSILNIFTSPQQALTKDFIDTATHINQGIETVLSNPSLLNLTEASILAKISFVGTSTGKPLIAQLATAYHVEASILFADVEIVQETPVGTLLISLNGSDEQIAKAFAFIEDSGVHVTRLSIQSKEVTPDDVQGN